MKKYLLILLAIIVCNISMAQSDYISYSAIPENDRLADLNGDCGILILSERSDLVICVTNATNVNKYRVTPIGKEQNGYYGYEVCINKDEARAVKVEVSRRGDVYNTNFVVRVKPDFFKAYLIEEVQRPIRMEDQTQATSAVLNEELAEVEFTTTIPDLKVECPPALRARVSSSKKIGDNSVTITSVTIPVKILETARQKLEKAKKAHDELEARLNTTTNAPDKDWETLDILQDEMEQAEQEMASLNNIYISGHGTNKLYVDISKMKPRQKLCYGVLLLKIEVPVNEFSAKVAEGGRLFSLREYEGAKRSFINASQLKEAPADLLPTLRTNIAHCDSCIKYERLTFAALKRINELKKQAAVAQTDIMNYYGAAADFMRIIEKYNPSEYYSKNIKTLETFIENMPVAMKFTFVRWIVNRVSAMEDGPFANVELWAYYGANTPRLNDYTSDRKFRKLVSNSPEEYKHIGTSDAQGIVDIQLNRKSLPTGFFFRPASDNSSPIVYKDVTDIMSQSVGEYNKRQFRQKMYIK